MLVMRAPVLRSRRSNSLVRGKRTGGGKSPKSRVEANSRPVDSKAIPVKCATFWGWPITVTAAVTGFTRARDPSSRESPLLCPPRLPYITVSARTAGTAKAAMKKHTIARDDGHEGNDFLIANIRLSETDFAR